MALGKCNYLEERERYQKEAEICPTLGSNYVFHNFTLHFGMILQSV